ncbi:MAG: penicillin-binding protein 2 [Pseudomonadota bacterium]
MTHPTHPRASSRRRPNRKWVEPDYAQRRRVLLYLLVILSLLLLAQLIFRQVLETDFLQDQGELRYQREVEIPAHRGVITDRHGDPLAISTPVESLWVNPRHFHPDGPSLTRLAQIIGRDKGQLAKTLETHAEKNFLYLRRRMDPDSAEQVRQWLATQPRRVQAKGALRVTAAGLQREYRRFYPAGEVSAHVVGYTDVDDDGQEGLELTYNSWLEGKPGLKRVIKDGQDRIVEEVESIQAPAPGRELVLSIDQRLQFLTYLELKAAVQKHKAKAGSAVILDVHTGEVLALVNQPSYNPNAKRDAEGGRLRNRALTDVFEPGSTIKPFIVAFALEAGRVRPDTPIETSPGTLSLGGHTIKDVHNYGRTDVTGVITKSSNVGITKISLGMLPEVVWQGLSRVGFGVPLETHFPQEAQGSLPHYKSWNPFVQATISFGYGVSSNLLQLARAYSVIANDGILLPVSLLKVEEAPAGERVMSAAVAKSLRTILETVVSPTGTAQKAALDGYRVAGKTGTAKKSMGHSGYADKKYTSAFVGMVPASDPRLVMAVLIDDPSEGDYYGGLVAAPVFGRLMAGAVRLLNIPPDRPDAVGLRLAGGGKP